MLGSQNLKPDGPIASVFAPAQTVLRSGEESGQPLEPEPCPARTEELILAPVVAKRLHVQVDDVARDVPLPERGSLQAFTLIASTAKHEADRARLRQSGGRARRLLRRIGERAIVGVEVHEAGGVLWYFSAEAEVIAAAACACAAAGSAVGPVVGGVKALQCGRSS